MPLLKATDGMHKEKQGLDAHNKKQKTLHGAHSQQPRDKGYVVALI